MREFPMIKGLSPNMVRTVFELYPYRGRWVPRTFHMNTCWALHDRNFLWWKEPDLVTLTDAGQHAYLMIKEAMDNGR